MDIKFIVSVKGKIYFIPSTNPSPFDLDNEEINYDRSKIF